MYVDAISLGTTSPMPFAETVEACRAALAEQGFGILHEFDFGATLREKTHTDIGPYRVLAACHPPSAAKALTEVPSVGVLLPCNLAVYERDGAVTVRAIDPRSQMKLLDRDEIDDMAGDIARRLRAVLDSIAALQA